MAEFSIRMVSLGDSTGVGVGATDGHGGYVERLFQRLRAHRHPVGLLNLCRNGATSSTVVADQLPRALSARPTLVTLAVGGNDLWRQTDEATFARNIETLLQRLSQTGARGLIANVPDLSHAPVAQLVPLSMYGPRLLSFNESIAHSANKHGFVLIDLFQSSRQDLPGHPEYFCGDGFHPSSEGYARWTELLCPAVERLVREPSSDVGTAR